MPLSLLCISSVLYGSITFKEVRPYEPQRLNKLWKIKVCKLFDVPSQQKNFSTVERRLIDLAIIDVCEVMNNTFLKKYILACIMTTVIYDKLGCKNRQEYDLFTQFFSPQSKAMHDRFFSNLLYEDFLGNQGRAKGLKNNVLRVTLERNDAITFQRLIDLGANINCMNEKQERLLHTIATSTTKGMDTVYLNMLLEKKVLIDVRDAEGNTPLMLAVLFNKKEMIELLLKHNADIGVPNLKGETALDIAKHSHKEEIVQLLKKKINQSPYLFNDFDQAYIVPKNQQLRYLAKPIGLKRQICKNG